ncbi:MAG TPA: threonine--tRNA ligase [Bacillota bacterium]|nr:threonine--tRNA ligase [Bacillota bacterium]HOL01878.1 threonine--tRNA ligase [Bacillota bacterium]HPO79837.1 threonine--tRNA ligase [Bacillota bacterium]
MSLSENEKELEILRHSTSHVMAQAVKRLFPDVKVAIGPAIENGFYYDFDKAEPFTQDDLGLIEEEMAKIIKEDLPIVREEIPREEAVAMFREAGEAYKAELIEDMPEDEVVSLYRQGEFVDLCRGPHLESTGKIKAFKLLSVAGAYWRGDEKNKMLQRIYGTAFPTVEELDRHLEMLKEAEKRDHRRLGRDLDIFSIHEEGGAGLVYWHPKGGIIRKIIEDFWRDEHLKRGYDLVFSPHIAKKDLWEISGHWGWYRENIYSPIDIDGVEYILKPMNCPFHILMYKTRTRSYRDLPLRWAELGTVYRYERSGVLHGMLRVRGFTQDDAHLFMRPDQLEEEIIGVIDLVKFMMEAFQYKEYEFELSVRDPNRKQEYAGSDDIWDLAENALISAMNKAGIEFRRMEGEAKFYGPAIDVHIKDALGRGWQGPTIQVDFNLPQRFGLYYIGEDNAQHQPVMIHRTVLGSMERFVAGLIEHYNGAFPVWLAPSQVRIIPIADRHIEYAKRVEKTFRDLNLRVETDARPEKVGYKIREAQLEKVPYMIIVGDKEVSEEKISVRSRSEGDLGQMAMEEFTSRILKEISERV